MVLNFSILTQGHPTAVEKGEGGRNWVYIYIERERDGRGGGWVGGCRSEIEGNMRDVFSAAERLQSAPEITGPC